MLGEQIPQTWVRRRRRTQMNSLVVVAAPVEAPEDISAAAITMRAGIIVVVTRGVRCCLLARCCEADAVLLLRAELETSLPTARAFAVWSGRLVLRGGLRGEGEMIVVWMGAVGATNKILPQTVTILDPGIRVHNQSPNLAGYHLVHSMASRDGTAVALAEGAEKAASKAVGLLAVGTYERKTAVDILCM